MQWILLVETRNVGLVTNIPKAELSQCLTSIRKLGNRRSSEGLCSFKPSNSTVRHRIDSLNVRNAKNASTLHAQTLVTTNS